MQVFQSRLLLLDLKYPWPWILLTKWYAPLFFFAHLAQMSKNDHWIHCPSCVLINGAFFEELSPQEKYLGVTWNLFNNTPSPSFVLPTFFFWCSLLPISFNSNKISHIKISFLLYLPSIYFYVIFTLAISLFLISVRSNQIERSN